MCCSRSDGSARAPMYYFSYVVIDPAGNEVQRWPSFIEASHQRNQLGEGFTVTTRRDAETP